MDKPCSRRAVRRRRSSDELVGVEVAGLEARLDNARGKLTGNATFPVGSRLPADRLAQGSGGVEGGQTELDLLAPDVRVETGIRPLAQAGPDPVIGVAALHPGPDTLLHLNQPPQGIMFRLQDRIGCHEAIAG